MRRRGDGHGVRIHGFVVGDWDGRGAGRVSGTSARRDRRVSAAKGRTVSQTKMIESSHLMRTRVTHCSLEINANELKKNKIVKNDTLTQTEK